MSERGFVVAESWLRKIEDAASTSPESGGRRGSGSALFYDIRPARLQTAWTQNAAGLWTATARFVVNDAVDNSFTFPVCAPTATSSPGGTAETTRFFVVWRGRWELLSSASGGGSSQKPTVTQTTVVSSVGSTRLNAVTDVEIQNTREQITYITDVSTDSGALVFTTEQKYVMTAAASVLTQSLFVSEVSKSSVQVVGSIVWPS